MTLDTAPMCSRTDTLVPVMAALVGDARIQPVATDPHEAAIRAILQAPPKPVRRRHRA